MANPIPIIDTHQHLWYPNVYSNPWLAGESEELQKEHSDETYIGAIGDLQVVGTVFVEADCAKEELNLEAQKVLELCADTESVVKGAVIGCDLTSSIEDFSSFVTLHKESSQHFKGIRQVLHVLPKGTILQEHVLEKLRYLGENSISFDVCIQPDQLSDVAEAARLCPGTIFIVDHCGGHQGLRRDDVTFGEALPADPLTEPPTSEEADCASADGFTDIHQYTRWRRGIVELGQLSNVICKLSGLYGGWSSGMKNWSLEVQLPTVRHVLSSFPHDRLILGSDWPVCDGSGSAPAYLSAMRDFLLAEVGEEVTRNICLDNAIVAYRLDRDELKM